MMALPQEETPPPPSSNGSLALVRTASDKNCQSGEELAVVRASQSDLELHLLQTFAVFAGQQLVGSYLAVKHATRFTRFLGDWTEALASRSGAVALVRLLFAQYMRLGHPFVQQVDDAMGARIIDAVVSLLMLAEQRPEHAEQPGILALEADPSDAKSSSAAKLSYAERLQALLLGEVPRMQSLVLEARRKAQEATKAANMTLPPVVMELRDFVPLDEVARIKEENKAQLRAAMQDAARARAELAELTRDKQRLEQRLTDVHNYQESERGRRFQDMEEELARTKLEASQKSHDLRKLELVVEAMRRKRKSKSGSRTGGGRSNASETGPLSPDKSSSPERTNQLEDGSKRAAGPRKSISMA